jgi:osmotically-inducible protein OsmY
MNKSAMTIRRIVISGLLLSGVLALQGCIEAVIVGGAASGVLVIADRRQPDVMVSDERIEIQIGQRLGDQFKTAHINTISYNKMVLLTGEVANAAAKAQAEKIAQSISEVRSVVNELQIGPASSFGNRGNDSFISGKVKAAFISHAKFQPNHVKVITEGGVVYLLGLVTRGEAETATEIARTVGGVQKVVRVFEYIAAPPANEAPAAAGDNAKK